MTTGTNQASATPTIDVETVRRRLGDLSLTIVDIRPLAAYNGWRLGTEQRGGHIPGATAFPAEWLRTVDEPEIAKLLDRKGITSGGEIVVYGSELDDPAPFVDKLRSLGIAGARVLDGGFEAWAADPADAVDRLANYDKLVTIEWLRRVQAGETPEAA